MSSTVEYRSSDELPDGVDVAISAQHGRVVFLIRSTLAIAEATVVMCQLADVYMSDFRLVQMLGA